MDEEYIKRLEQENKELLMENVYLKGKVEVYEKTSEEVLELANNMQTYIPMLDYVSDTIKTLYSYLPNRIQQAVPQPTYSNRITSA